MRKTRSRIYWGDLPPVSKPGGGKNGSSVLAHCAACGEEYEKTRDWQHFCSTKCRRDSWKADKLNARKLLEFDRRLRVIEAAILNKGEMS